MGEVYRARDPRLGRDVAIKVLPAQSTENADRLRRFEREARALAALDHPHILALHDVGSEDGVSYLVFELLEGQTLRDRLAQGALPVRKCLEWGVQICRGLAAAHAQGIVHRDLKPENIGLTGDGRIKILDFGLAKLTELAGTNSPSDETRTRTEPNLVLGTAGYMAPEQVRGAALDSRSDIFSLGAVLYEMLTGRRAFEGDTSADRISAILHRDPPEMTAASAAIPAGLERVVRRCLEKDPEERFQSARDLAFALEHQSGTSLTGPVPKPAPPARRARWVAAALALVLAAAAMVSILSGLRRERRVPQFKQLTFRQGMVLNARFTADGNTVAYSGFFDANPMETYVTRLDRPESLRIDLPAARLVGVSSLGELAIVLTKPGVGGLAQNGTLARVSLTGGAPREVLTDVWWADWSPDGRELAVVHRVDDALQLEYPIGRVIQRPAAVTDEGFSFRVSPRGDRVAFNGTDGRVSVVSRDSSAITLGSGLHGTIGLAWDPAGDAIWVMASGSSTLSRTLWRLGLDGTAREAASFPGDVMIHDVSRDGRMLVQNGFEREGIRARAPGESRERDMCPLGRCAVPILAPDGQHVLFADRSGQEANTLSSYTLFLRPTRGGAAVRLGEGFPMAFSPDGRWVLSLRGERPQTSLELVPTGPGRSRTLNTEGLDIRGWAWFFDASHVVLIGGSPGGWRMYSVDLEGGKPAPFLPEKVYAIERPVGGSLLCAAANGSLAWHPLAGGADRPIGARVPVGTTALRLSADARFLYISVPGFPARIDRLDLSTGQRVPWQTLMPSDPDGVVIVGDPSVTPDGKAYAYWYFRCLQDLYLVDGVR
jgi:hypothetical protein